MGSHEAGGLLKRAFGRYRYRGLFRHSLTSMKKSSFRIEYGPGLDDRTLPTTPTLDGCVQS